MPKITTMTVRVTPERSGKLEALARDTKRSKSYLAGEAIASVEMNAWQVARIKTALAEARSGAPGVPHQEVVRWVESWETRQRALETRTGIALLWLDGLPPLSPGFRGKPAPGQGFAAPS
jgi:predicted transcriptional regulator